MIISVAGTLVSLYKIRVTGIPEITGFGTTGTANVTITAQISINITSNVDFGTGTPAAGGPTELTTESNNTLGFANCTAAAGLPPGQAQDCRGLEMENIGNVYINVTMSASSGPNAFFLGDDAQDEFQFATLPGNRSKGKGGGCNNNTLIGPNLNNGSSNYSVFPLSSSSTFLNWTDITTTTSPVCFNLSFDITKNAITIEFNISIPQDEPTGTRINTFTFTGTQI